MTPDRNQAARELLAFYLEAGVDAVLGETAVDRFADPAELSSPPASGRPALDRTAEPQSRNRPALDPPAPPAGGAPALDRTAEPQSGNRPALDRTRPVAPTVAASPGPLPPDSA